MAVKPVYHPIPRGFESLHEQLTPFEGKPLNRAVITKIMDIIQEWEKCHLPDPVASKKLTKTLASQLKFLYGCEKLHTFLFPNGLIATSIALTTSPSTEESQIFPNCRITQDGRFLKKSGDIKKRNHEAHMLLSLPHHPNILGLLAIESNDYGLCLVLPYHPLGDLFDFHTKPDGIKEQIPTVAKDLATGVRFIHEKGLLHLDLKPENIVLESLPDGRIRAVIIDFECAIRYPLEKPKTASLNPTMLYLPPEYFSCNSSVNNVYMEPSRDIWAVGLVLMWMINIEFFGDNFPMNHQITEDNMRSFFSKNTQKLIEQGLKQGIERLKNTLQPNQSLGIEATHEAATAALKIAPQDRISADNLCRLFAKLKI